MRFINGITWELSHIRKSDIRKLSPDTGKVAALAVERGNCEQKWKEWNISMSRHEESNFYKTVLNTCLLFLNEVMASEPFFEERSDAVKMSETPYPTNGSGKNLAKDTGVKYAFSVILCRILR